MGWIEQVVRPGMVAVDIGANVGTVTAPLAEAVGQAGKVFAIEPHQELVCILSALPGPIRVIHAAVCAVEAPVTLYRSKETPHASLYPANVRDPIDQVEVVLGVTLDGLQARGELPARVDVIKVDAQGAEVAILLGAQRLIEAQRPVLYLELWSEGLAGAGESVEAVRDMLEPLYDPDRLTWDQVVEQCNRERGHSAIDVLFLPRKV